MLIRLKKIFKNKADALNKGVAVTVALSSIFMAMSKVKDDNIGQAMADAKARMVDTWGEYQAKKIKHHINEESAFQLNSLLDHMSSAEQEAAKAHINMLKAEIERYKEEEKNLKEKAEGYDKTYDDLNFIDDQFDLSEGAMSISLGLLAVSALTENVGLFAVAWLFIGWGVIQGLSAFLNLGIHPTWLVKLIS